MAELKRKEISKVSPELTKVSPELTELKGTVDNFEPMEVYIFKISSG